MKAQLRNTNIVKSLFLRCAMGAMIAIFLALQAFAGEPFEMQVHENEVRGTQEVISGEYEKGIEKLEATLSSHPRLALSKKVAVLSNLCVAYTMIGDFESATEKCDLAVKTGWSKALTRNNRGVMQVAQGNYISAMGDFRTASNMRRGRRVASDNHARASASLLARQSSLKEPDTEENKSIGDGEA